MKGDRPALRSGRQQGLTRALLAEIESVFMLGATIKDACEYVGISQESYFRWFRVSEALANGETHADAPMRPKRKRGTTDEEYQLWMRDYEARLKVIAEFSQIVKRARAHSRIDALRVIKSATEREWQAAAWYLERSDPENWGRRVQQTQHDGQLTIRVVREDAPKEASDDRD